MIVQSCSNLTLNCKNKLRGLHLDNRPGQKGIVHKGDTTQARADKWFAGVAQIDRAID